MYTIQRLLIITIIFEFNFEVGSQLINGDIFESEIENISSENKFLYKKEDKKNRSSSRRLLFYPEYRENLSQFKEQYDFIIIGGGSAGCAIANRLSENKKWSILLIEAGKEEDWLTDVPIIAPILSTTDYVWGYKTEKEKNMYWEYEGNQVILPRGKVLGGSSVVNFMVYTRGNRFDWDRIANAGNPGWSYDEVVPYFMKSEKENLKYKHDPSYHNKSGLLSVENINYQTPLRDIFLRAGKKLGHRIIDYNADERIGFGYLQVNTMNGKRHSSAKAFLSPFKNRKNLKIVVQARVIKININPKTKRAESVVFLHNRKKYTIKTKKEIILSAGCISSPQLLMLSGVGPAEHLREIGIPVIKDLRIGDNIHDHLTFIGLVFTVNTTGVTAPADRIGLKNVIDWLGHGGGPLSLPSSTESIAFVKTDASEEKYDDPDLEIGLWSTSIPQLNAAKYVGWKPEFYEHVFSDITHKESFQLVPLMLHPKSRGQIRLKDKNPFHWPKISYDYFSDLGDLKTMIAGIRYILKLAQTEPFQKIGARLHDKKFPACERFEFDTDDYWECALRSLASPLQHHGGSCRMGPATDDKAVVDHDLNVYGINGLRIGDISILPRPLAAHTHAPAVMIGEKLADILKNKWSK